MRLDMALVSAAVMTFASRYALFIAGPALRRTIAHDAAARYMGALPVAILSALAVQGVFGGHAWLPPLQLAPFAGAAVIAWWSRNLVLTIAAALLIEAACHA